MGKFRASWEIFSRTLQIMRDHKTLLVFPIVTAACTMVLTAFFLAPIVLQPTGYRYTEAAHWKAVQASVFTEDSVKQLNDPATAKQTHSRDLHFNNSALGYLSVLYFISMFVAAFFNVAFSSQILSALKGGGVSVSAGLRFALARWQPILFWSLLTGLVGFIIQKLEQKFGFIGRLVIGLVGVVWSVASVFAIPVLVEENDVQNPINVLRKSAWTIKKTWGEALIGYAGLQLTGLLSLLVLLIFGAAAIALGVYVQSIWPPFVLMALWIVFTLVLSYLTSVAGRIYQCALYVYATTGQVPGQFDRPMMDAAWKRKS